MANRKFELKNSSSDVNSIPCVGFGLWKVPKNVCADVVFNGIKIGYRHLDCAADYGNEIEVGKVCKILKTFFGTSILNLGQTVSDYHPLFLNFG